MSSNLYYTLLYLWVDWKVYDLVGAMVALFESEREGDEIRNSDEVTTNEIIGIIHSIPKEQER